MIRALHAATDADTVLGLFTRAADYVMLESSRPPNEDDVADFFTSAPPGVDPAKSLHLGLFAPNGTLAAIAGVIFGFPNPDDAYLGLLLIDPDHRSKRLGQTMLEHIFTSINAPRILIAVLEENTKGRRFWAKMGFTEEMRSQPKQIGLKTHVQIRMARPL